MKRAIPICLAVGLAAALLVGAAAARDAQDISAGLVRLHVIAASDDSFDQAQKLRARDAVLKALEGFAPSDARAAAEQLAARLPELAEAAQSALQTQTPVTVRLCRETYPTRDYGTFALPAGEYASLQVRIGAAEGRNWWCVVYPALCRTAEGVEWLDAAEAAGFSDGQLRLIRTKPEEIQYRLKLAELLQRLRQILR